MACGAVVLVMGPPAACLLLLAPLAQEPEQVERSFCPLVGHLEVCVLCQASNPCWKGCQVRDNEKRKSARYSLCNRNVRCAEALLLEACTVALQEGAMKVL